MNSIRNCIAIVCVLTFLYHVPVVAQQRDSKLEKKLNTLLKENEAVGMAVVVVKDNQVVYHTALGYNDLENKTPLKEDNLFRIASVSKSFTTTSLLKLVEKGEISLQDNVSDLIGFPVVNPNHPDKVITLEMILSHTSSLNDSQRYFSLDIINPAKSKTFAKSYSKYPPGAEFKYCNLGYNLAGAILEKLHGKRFDNVIREQILDPLGMKAGFNVDSLDQSKFASLYVYKKDTQSFAKSTVAYRSPNLENYRIGYDAPRFSPTGGLKVSALDL